MAAPDSASATDSQECPSRGAEVSKIVYEATQNNTLGSMQHIRSIYCVDVKVQTSSSQERKELK